MEKVREGLLFYMGERGEGSISCISNGPVRVGRAADDQKTIRADAVYIYIYTLTYIDV